MNGITLPRHKVSKDPERGEKGPPVAFCLRKGKSGGRRVIPPLSPFCVHWTFKVTRVNRNPFSRCYIRHGLKRHVFFCVGRLCILLVARIPGEKRALSPSIRPGETAKVPWSDHHPPTQGWSLQCERWDPLVGPGVTSLPPPRRCRIGQGLRPTSTHELGFIEQPAREVCLGTNLPLVSIISVWNYCV